MVEFRDWENKWRGNGARHLNQSGLTVVPTADLPHTIFCRRIARKETNLLKFITTTTKNGNFQPLISPTPFEPSTKTPHKSAKMGRLHSNGKGISDSALPYSRSVPAWLKTTPAQVEEQICRLARKGTTPSQIGVVLRDSHGISQVRIVTGMQ